MRSNMPFPFRSCVGSWLRWCCVRCQKGLVCCGGLNMRLLQIYSEFWLSLSVLCDRDLAQLQPALRFCD